MPFFPLNAALAAWLLTSPQAPPRLRVKVGAPDCSRGTVYSPLVARSNAQRTKGLGGRRKPLGREEGMLFLFEKPEPRAFWMKDLHVPLSLFFFDPSGKLLSAQEMAIEPDPARPRRYYTENGKTLSALETAAGETARIGQGTESGLCVELPKLPD
jgi:uncharacterized protein